MLGIAIIVINKQHTENMTAKSKSQNGKKHKHITPLTKK